MSVRECGDNHVAVQMEQAVMESSRQGDDVDGDGELTDSKVDLLRAQDVDVDADMLAHALSSAGRWAFGIMAADVWVLSDKQTRLQHPSGGFWIDPVWRFSEPSEALERLSDPSREDYCAPADLAPGEGLAGALWNDVHPGGNKGPGVYSAFKSRVGGAKSVRLSAPHFLAINRGGWNDGNDGTDGESAKFRSAKVGVSALGINDRGGFGGDAGRNRKVVWRDVLGIANDPDQPPNERTKLLAEAGFHQAAAVPFNVRGHRGIVVYLSRASSNPEKLRSALNEEYLRGATDVIGAVSALREPRRACIEERREEARDALRRVRIKIFSFLRARVSVVGEATGTLSLESFIASASGGAKKEVKPPNVEETPPLRAYNCSDAMAQLPPTVVGYVKMWARKLRGGGIKIPPAMPWPQVLFSFVFSFLSMFIVLWIDKAIFNVSNNDLYYVLGPISSVQTMVFGLTQAPASQPRNILLSNIVSTPVGIALRYLHSPNDPWKMSLVVGIATLLQTAMGVVHPPATAMAVSFTTSTRTLGSNEWKMYGVMLFAAVVLIVNSTVFNNMSLQRQYPTSWGYLPEFLSSCIRGRKQKKKEKEEKEL